MVFQELLSFWRDQSALKHVFRNFDDMLKTSKNMFEMATESLFSEQRDIEPSKRRLVEMDSRLNTLQQVIRRDIITHIAVQGISDIVPCMVMMSVIKDAERTGDYTKNIIEIAEHCASIHNDPLYEELKSMRSKIAVWYDKTRNAIDKTDGNLAREAQRETYDLEKKCDKLIWDLASDNGGRNAVAAALMLRFFKRISAHLGNILTTVVMPFDKIDYFEKED